MSVHQLDRARFDAQPFGGPGLIIPGGLATARCEIEFTSGVWTDVSNRLAGLTTRVGRSHELQRDEAGQYSATLHNGDRRFEPNYAGSPFYPNILTWKRVRLLLDWVDVTYGLGVGYVQQWLPRWTGGGMFSQCDVQFVDGFALLTRTALSGAFPAEYGHQRIERCLDLAGWPAADRIIDTGLSRITAETDAQGNALSHIQEVCRAEGARFYINGDGLAVFRNRYFGVLGANATPQVTFDNTSTDGSWFKEPVVAFDSSRLFNQTVVTRRDESDVRYIATDATSVAAHDVTLDLQLSGLIIDSRSEAQDIAEFSTALYADDQLRVQQLALVPEASPGALWPEVLGRQLADRVRVKVPPPGGGALLDQECFVESIEHRVVFGQTPWQTTYRLTPLFLNYGPPSPWIVGTSALGSGKLDY